MHTICCPKPTGIALRASEAAKIGDTPHHRQKKERKEEKKEEKKTTKK